LKTEGKRGGFYKKGKGHLKRTSPQKEQKPSVRGKWNRKGKKRGDALGEKGSSRLEEDKHPGGVSSKKGGCRKWALECRFVLKGKK